MAGTAKSRSSRRMFVRTVRTVRLVILGVTVLVRVCVEFVYTFLGMQVERAPGVLAGREGGVRVNHHSTNRIFDHGLGPPQAPLSVAVIHH